MDGRIIGNRNQTTCGSCGKLPKGKMRGSERIKRNNEHERLGAWGGERCHFEKILTHCTKKCLTVWKDVGCSHA